MRIESRLFARAASKRGRSHRESANDRFANCRDV
jgi:hypothetical protein